MKYKFFIFIILLVLLTLFIYIFIFLYYMKDLEILHIQEMPIYVTVFDYVGINLDNSSLNFGTIMPGNNVVRQFTIINPFKTDVLVSIDFKGLSWIQINENYFILKQGELKNITITLSVPKDAKFGNYRGSMRVIMEGA